MAKKELNDDLFSGGLISDNEKKAKSSKKKKIISDKLRKGFSANTRKVIKRVVAIVVVVALLATYVSTGLVRKGFVHSTLQWTTYVTGITVKSDEDGSKIRIPVSTYNYYYSLTYNNYKSTQEYYANYDADDSSSILSSLLGLLQPTIDADFDQPLSKQTTTDDDGNTITWQDYMYNEVIDTIEETYTYYLAAVRANDGVEPEITSTQQSELEETLTKYKEAAEGYGYTLSGYLVAVMGKGVTEKVFRRESIRSYIADNYKKEISGEKITIEHTDEDYQEYRDKNEANLKTVNIRIFEAEKEEDAAAFLSELNEDGSNFTELASKYATDDFYKAYYSESTATTMLYATRDALKNLEYSIANADETDDEDAEKTYSGLNWLFSEERQIGDKAQFSTSVVFVSSPATFPEKNTINIRHILVSPNDDASTATSATDEEWAKALEEAQSILDEFNKGDKTADSFAELVHDNTDDSGSKETGGLYSNVAPGEMVLPFNNWCFKDGRTAGDCAIIRSSLGYHIMYFDSETDTPVWKAFAESQITSSESTLLSDQLEEEFVAKVNWLGSRYFEIDTDIDS